VSASITRSRSRIPLGLSFCLAISRSPQTAVGVRVEVMRSDASPETGRWVKLPQ
jgi:hypothetical protein